MNGLALWSEEPSRISFIDAAERGGQAPQAHWMRGNETLVGLRRAAPREPHSLERASPEIPHARGAPHLRRSGTKRTGATSRIFIVPSGFFSTT